MRRMDYQLSSVAESTILLSEATQPVQVADILPKSADRVLQPGGARLEHHPAADIQSFETFGRECVSHGTGSVGVSHRRTDESCDPLRGAGEIAAIDHRLCCLE